MKKPLKILGVIAVFVVVLMIALVVIAKIVITPERVKQTVLPLAEEALNRKVELGEISVSLFSGIELNDLKLYEADGREVFVSTDLVRLKYQLLPLLSMKVVVDEVRVVKPQIRVIRKADGSFSFDDMAGDGQQSSDGAQEAGEASSEPPISLLVSEVSIEDGQLLFLDHQVSAQTPYRTEISGLQFSAQGVTLTGSVPISLQCNINGGRIEAKGSVRPGDPSGRLDLKLSGIDALAFNPYFKDAVPGRLDSLTINLETSVEGNFDAVTANGRLDLTKLDLVLDALPDASLKQARIGLDYDLGVDLKNGRADLRQLELDFNGLVATLRGAIDRLFNEPVVALQLSVPGVELRQAMSSLPSGLVAGVKGLDPAGTVSLDAELAGGFVDPLKLLKSATVKLDNVQATAGGQRPSLGGQLIVRDASLVSDGLEVRMGDNRAGIDLEVRNLFADTIIARADVTSEQFLLDPLLQTGAAAGGAAGDGGSGSSKEQGGSSAQTEELGPFDIPAQASGTISIGKTLYKGLAIDDFVAEYQLKENVLTISRMDGKVAGGGFANTARVDLGKKGLAYTADLGINSIQADPLLTAFSPKAAGALLGAMNLDMSIKGRGTQWEMMSKKLAGQGDMLISDGRVVSPGLVKGFSSILKLSDTDEIRFNNFKGNVRIVDGRLMLDSSISGDEIKLYPKGSIGLDGSLDLSLDTRLSPKLSGKIDSKGEVTRYLTDKDGWSQVPLLISGSYASPSFGLDPKGLQAQATQAVTSELEKQVDKLFKKQREKSGDDGVSSDKEEDPSQKLIKDSLKQLFGQ